MDVSADQVREARAAGVWTAAGVAGLGFGLWAITWSANETPVLWPKLEDDAFYYYEIARGVLTGRGPNMDGLHDTNGYHPLWMAVCLALWSLGLGAVTQITLVQGLQLAMTAGLAGALARFNAERVGPFIAVLASSILLFPRYFNLMTNGLESTLLAGLTLATVYAWLRSPPRPDAPTWRGDLLLGVVLAALGLTRLDAVLVSLFVALALVFETWRSGPGQARRALARGALALGPLVSLMIPYLAYNLTRFGHPVPISGRLKSAHGELGAGLHALKMHPEYIALLFPALLGVFLCRQRHPRLALLLAAMTLANLGHLAHTLLFMKWAIMAWHYVAYLIPGLIGVALVTDALLRSRPRWISQAAALSAVAVMSSLLVWSVFKRDTRFSPAVIEAAGWAAAELGPDALLGLTDSGHFTYYSGHRVVNLDGLVNTLAYQETVCRGELEPYLKAIGVTHLVHHGLRDADTYEAHRLRVACHLASGVDSWLTLPRTHEVYRSKPFYYTNRGDEQAHAVIWRAPWATAP